MGTMKRDQAVAEHDDVVAGDIELAARQLQYQRLVLRLGMAVKSKVSRLFTAGKRASRISRSTRRRS